ncbi:MAG: serine hydrolase [Rhizobiaceae bacterium]
MRTAIGSTRAPSVWAIACFLLSLLVATGLQVSHSTEAEAAKKRKVTKNSKPNPRYAAYVIDAKTGKVLFSRYANSRRYPASLTKMMTLYLIFEDLKSGRIKLNSRLVMSKAGARREPSKLGIKAGKSISMEQAIYALVTKSANDVATAIGDQLDGSEAKFAKRMTLKARQLGMKNTTFKNANGLTAKGQITTASDMAKLGLALREHFPKRYKYFQTRSFKYGKRNYRNHNRLLGKVRGVDGIKTGYTRASGFNLVSSVSTNGRRIVAVVMGGRTGRSRNAHMEKLIRTYLPKASRGAAKKLVPPFKSSRDQRGKVNIKKTNPLPVTKVAKNIKAMPISTTPTPQLRRSLTKQLNAQKAQVKYGQPLAPTPQVAPKGWQIQITASDDRSKALDMLKKAKSRNKRLLASASPYTEVVVKNGTRLYRGRFVGFSSKASARRACKVLKKQRFSCLALNG